MNPGVKLLLVLACASVAVLLYFVFEVLLFRLACRMAGAPRPGVGRSVGIVLAVLAAVSAVEAAVSSGILEAYIAGGYPLWEAGLVAFFVGLPVHMLVASAVHARMMRMAFAEGLAVWFVEKAVKLGMVAFGGGAVALVYLLSQAFN